MKWEHVIHSIDPKTAVREVHIALEDKEVVIKETPDGRRETYEIDTKGSKFGADYTKPAPFDCTAEYWGDGKGMQG